MIEINTNPTAREIKLFGLLWLAFFALVAAVAWFRPGGLAGASVILGTAWLVSLVFNPDNRLRQLAGIALPALFAAVGFGLRAGVPTLPVVAALCGVGLVGAAWILISPGFGRSLYVGWMIAAAPIGWTISHLVLAAVYYLVLTPIGLVMRLFGYDPMKRRHDESAESYWIERKQVTETERYFRQF